VRRDAIPLEAAREAGKLAAADALVVGKSVLVLDDGIWQPAVVARLEGDAVDVKIQGWKEKMGLPRTKALVVSYAGAGALVRRVCCAGFRAGPEVLSAGLDAAAPAGAVEGALVGSPALA
jgi:hypothetical protein